MKVLADTNILILLGQKIDIFEMLGDVYTTSSCVKELNKIANSKKNDASAAKIALEFMKNVNIIETNSPADNSIKELAEKEKFAVATNDKMLIKSLEQNNIKIVRLRQGKFLD